jgi:hypothetical protein
MKFNLTPRQMLQLADKAVYYRDFESDAGNPFPLEDSAFTACRSSAVGGWVAANQLKVVATVTVAGESFDIARHAPELYPDSGWY